MRIVLAVLFGMKIGLDGLSFDPWLPPALDHATLEGVAYCGSHITIELVREGSDARARILGG